jgi:A/G-specific adenine glycosylase
MVSRKRPRKQSLTLRQVDTKRSKETKESHFTYLQASGINSASDASQQLVLRAGRKHAKCYHQPALLDGESARTALLDWFETVSNDRVMPWRQKWIDPVHWKKEQRNPGDDLCLREVLKRRAYQVWISEIMLQQTRVETVRSYYNAWHTRWPTVEDLARAEPSDVLSAWRGLGYYSRATRIHAAAKKIVSDPTMDGLLPEFPAELESKVPGIGPYTAGAISSIVFGHAVPILDGNVARVLCRQTGLYANMKSKKTTDLLWETAGKLVRAAARNADVGKGKEMERDHQVPKSEIPSLWNQALMELGSTVCKPLKPNCSVCPIKVTCRAYREGEELALNISDLESTKSKFFSTYVPHSELIDVEDLCTLCEPMETVDESFENGDGVTSKQRSTEATSKDRRRAQETIDKHISLFPMKVVKKPTRKEECIVCIIEKKEPGRPVYLIEQRPDKGLLASLWQFPSLDISSERAIDSQLADGSTAGAKCFPRSSAKVRGMPSTTTKSGAVTSSIQVRESNNALLATTTSGLAERKKLASQFVSSVLQDIKSHNESYGSADTQSRRINHINELGITTHLFSHITLIMYVHLFEIVETSKKSRMTPAAKITIKPVEHRPRKWSSQEEIENENIGTGMRRCWAMFMKET